MDFRDEVMGLGAGAVGRITGCEAQCECRNDRG